MAAPKASPAKPVTRSNRKSVPQPESKPKPRASVARGVAPGRATAKSGGARQQALPTVQSEGAGVGPYPSDKYPSVDPAAIAGCFNRARTDLRWTAVSWDPKVQQWEVPSSDRRRGTYRVRRRPGVKGKVPWWKGLQCNCAAEESGMYLACWHKAAVVLLWRYTHQVNEAHANGQEGPDPADM